MASYNPVGDLHPDNIGLSGVTTPTTNRIRSAQSAATVLLLVIGVVVAPLALISRLEHSHPLALDGQQVAHRHSHGDPGLDDGRSHHHHDHTHHHHDHSHHHHATTESTEVHDGSRSSRKSTKSEVSPSSRHQHFNLFGHSFTIHCDGHSNTAMKVEENQSVDFSFLVVRVLDIRSTMPPADVIVDSSLIWQPFFSYESLDDDCEADQPGTPPPESAFC